MRTFTRTTTHDGERIDIKCDSCGAGVNTSAETMMGQHLAATWPGVHKCDTRPAL